MDIFIELSGMLLLATGISFVMKVLKQPLIVGYILTGILVGPEVLGILHSTEHIELFSKIGVTVLLFIVGLSLSPRVIREVGAVSLVTGIGQVFFTSVIGFLIAIALGIDKLAAMYVAIALTFSSTIIILKLLSDKGDLHKLYGKIAVGFLLVQDIVATIILLVISSLADTSNQELWITIGLLVLKGLLSLGVLLVIQSIVLPHVAKFIAKSQELLFLFSISWGLGLATAFSLLGFSVEIGALVAGVLLSTTPFALEAGSRLRPLRDFFIILFFILLGSQMVLENLGTLIVPAIALSAFVLIGNPIIVVVMMNLLGFKRRTGFLAGLTVAQISEFSLILAALGYRVGHLSQEILSLVTLVGLVTIAGSTYLILYSDRIYPKVDRLLRFLELRKKRPSAVESADDKYELVLFGHNRVGQDFVRLFNSLKRPFIVVDFNPSAIQSLKELNIPHRYGDADDLEFLEELNAAPIKLVVSTIPDQKTNVLLTKTIRSAHPRAIIVVLSHDTHAAKELYEHGASYVMMPHYLGARYTTTMLSRVELDTHAIREEREKHLAFLATRT